MPTSIDSMIDRQLRRWEMDRLAARERGLETPHPAAQPLITVSRQHGSSGAEIAALLAERFQYPLLHRDIIDRICQSTGHARRLLEILDERTQPQLTNWVESMLAGRFVDSSDYLRGLHDVLHTMSHLGGVVVVGRGANFAVGLDHGFHVRVVAPREQRMHAIAERKGIGLKEAAREIDARDRERAEFIRKLYDRDVNDPLGYDVVVNEASRRVDAIVRSLEIAAIDKFERLRQLALQEH